MGGRRAYVGALGLGVSGLGFRVGLGGTNLECFPTSPCFSDRTEGWDLGPLGV